MKTPKELYQQAMHYSHLAQCKLEAGEIEAAHRGYRDAAHEITKATDQYKDVPEPTRQKIFRSSAFLNLKAGNRSQAEYMITLALIGNNDKTELLHLKDARISYEALDFTAPEGTLAASSLTR